MPALRNLAFEEFDTFLEGQICLEELLPEDERGDLRAAVKDDEVTPT